MKSKSYIRKNLRELRNIIDNSKDPLEVSLAYEMECAVRWAVEDTVGWPSLARQVKMGADSLRSELKGK
jgi:hypothetical protein